MRIKAYDLINQSALSSDDVILVETDAGTKTLKIKDIITSLASAEELDSKMNFETITLSALNNRTTPLNAQTIYGFNGRQGFILPSVTGSKETQYYFADDGILRYRTRSLVNGEGEAWGSTQFKQYPNSLDGVLNGAMKFETSTQANNYVEGTVYKYTGEGLIIPIVNSTRETQYYFAPDGTLRYRTRTRANNNSSWGEWDPAGNLNFYAYPSPDTVMKFERTNDLDGFADNTINKWAGQGLIMPVNTDTQQAQYYFAQDGVMRYRYRSRSSSSDPWGGWVDGNNFLTMVNQENLGAQLNAYISFQNRADKYFLKTCVNKSKIKINFNTQILAFGDSITKGNEWSDHKSWLEPFVDEVGCPDPYNLAVVGASFVANSNTLAAQLNTLTTEVNAHRIDLSAVDLIIIAAGTNDAFNGSPINTFSTNVSSFLTNLRTKFSTAGINCPPILFITPIRRGSWSDINASSESNVEIKLAKYGAVICNIALANDCSVINGFDFPITTDNITVTDTNGNSTTLQSFMNTGDSQHLHPNYPVGLKIYAQAVINAVE